MEQDLQTQNPISPFDTFAQLTKMHKFYFYDFVTYKINKSNAN